jgi:hypothetical protein
LPILWQKFGLLMVMLFGFFLLHAQRLPIEKWVGNIRHEGAVRWQLSYSCDDYMGRKVKPNAFQTILFQQDRSVEWFRFGRRYSGLWSVDPDRSRITFVLTHVDGMPLNENAYQNDFLLEAYGDGRMVMQQQGRHGSVRMVYRQLPAGN